LNTWGGRAGKDKILNFFNKYKDIDIFCLQEIWSEHNKVDMVSHNGDIQNSLQDIAEILSDYFFYFRPQCSDNYGLVMFVKKNINIVEEGEIFVHRSKGHVPVGDENNARNLQYIKIETKDNPIVVMNFHGLWNDKNKMDSEDRLLQSEKMVDFIKRFTMPIVLCGDFNMLPDTKSLKMVEDVGLVNLIKKFNITSTRTSFYNKPVKFADYCLVSKDIKVKDFKVLPDEVSDHSPLYIEIG
jgi:endonuclease/exonuclease/phosphatase family metal-dependent hydrolase